MSAGVGTMESVPWAAIAPLAVLAIAFAAYCVVEVVRHDVRYLPKWAWVLVCVLSIPVGGIVYLLAGRVHR